MAKLEPTGSIECDTCGATAPAFEGWVTGVYHVSQAEGDYAPLAICPACIAGLFLKFQRRRLHMIDDRANDVAWLQQRHGSVRVACTAHFAAAETALYAGEWGQVWRPEQDELEGELLELERQLARHGVDVMALRKAEDADRPAVSTVSTLLERLMISSAEIGDGPL